MKLNTAKGLFWDEKGKEFDLQEALEQLAKCGCGFSCCKNAFFIDDANTGDRMKVQIKDGSFVITNETNPG